MIGYGSSLIKLFLISISIICTVETATADSLGIQITKYSDECSGLAKSEVCSEISTFLLGAQGQKKTFKFVLHLKSKFNVYYIFNI